jgi:hypothetical protein
MERSLGDTERRLSKLIEEKADIVREDMALET